MRCAESLFERSLDTMPPELVVLLVEAGRDDREMYPDDLERVGVCWRNGVCQSGSRRSC